MVHAEAFATDFHRIATILGWRGHQLGDRFHLKAPLALRQRG